MKVRLQDKAAALCAARWMTQAEQSLSVRYAKCYGRERRYESDTCK